MKKISYEFELHVSLCSLIHCVDVEELLYLHAPPWFNSDAYAWVDITLTNVYFTQLSSGYDQRIYTQDRLRTNLPSKHIDWDASANRDESLMIDGNSHEQFVEKLENSLVIAIFQYGHCFKWGVNMVNSIRLW